MKKNTQSSTLIGKIVLNHGNEIRLEISKYYGRHNVNIRRWFITREGNLTPTRKGIEFSIEHIAALDVLVHKAHKVAHRTGLLPKKKGG